MPDLEETVSEILDLIDTWGSFCEDEPGDYRMFDMATVHALQMDLYKCRELLASLIESTKES